VDGKVAYSGVAWGGIISCRKWGSSGFGSRVMVEWGREGGGAREGAVGMEVWRIQVGQGVAAESGKEAVCGVREGVGQGCSSEAGEAEDSGRVGGGSGIGKGVGQEQKVELEIGRRRIQVSQGQIRVGKGAAESGRVGQGMWWRSQGGDSGDDETANSGMAGDGGGVREGSGWRSQGSKWAGVKPRTWEWEGGGFRERQGVGAE